MNKMIEVILYLVSEAGEKSASLRFFLKVCLPDGNKLLSHIRLEFCSVTRDFDETVITPWIPQVVNLRKWQGGCCFPFNIERLSHVQRS